MIRLEPRFAELAGMTNFSFLRGASHPEEMVARAAELGFAGVGIADRNTLAGVVRAHVFARENAAAVAGTRVVPGARLAFADGAPDLLAYPKDRAAYGRLCRILTAGNLRAPKGECWLRLEDLLEHGEGLQIVALSPLSPCGRGVGGEGSGAVTRLAARDPSPERGWSSRLLIHQGARKRMRTHPALRATFSRKGRRGRSPASAKRSARASGSARA